MKWEKKGLIYRTDNRIDWAMDRAIAPVCELLSDQKLRIYFSTRDKSGRSTPVFLESNPEKPENIYNLFSSPILQFGPPGTFDDNGILVSSIVTNGDTKYLYYVGWNRKVEVPYHLSIGLAISDGDAPFRKISDGPILDRSDLEPYFCTAPFVLKENDSWKMWYVSGTGWKKFTVSKNHFTTSSPLHHMTAFTGPPPESKLSLMMSSQKPLESPTFFSITVCIK